MSLRTQTLCVCGSLVAGCVFAGSEIVWKGGGSTAAWSDGTNWQGGVAPGLGDVAVLPDATTVTAGPTDLTYMEAAATKLAGIRLMGDGTRFVLSGLTKAATFDVPLSGKGEFQHRDSKKTGGYYLTLAGDNREFAGSFLISNAGVRVNSDYCLGTTNVVRYFGSSSTENYFQFNTGHVSSNEFHVTREWLFYGANGAKLYGPLYLNGNVRAEASNGDNTFELLGGVAYESASGNFIPGNNCRLGGTKPIILGSHDLMLNRGKVYLAAPIESVNMVSVDSKSVSPYFEADNVLPVTATLRFGNSATAGHADLGGHDQRCGEFKVWQAAMDAVNTYLTSAKSATFTICNKGPASFNGQLKGAVSLELNSTNSATAGSIGLAGTNNTTTGSLIVRRGTLTVAAAARFPNLTSLVVSGEGKMVVNTSAVGNGADAAGLCVVATNAVAGALKLAAGVSLKADTMVVGDGKWLEAGVYGGPDSSAPRKLDCLTGTGTVTVSRYGGKLGLILMVR